MNHLVSCSLLVAALLVAMGTQSTTALHQQQQQHPDGLQASSDQRQERSLSSSGSNLNTIDSSSSKSKLDQEKRAVQEFLTTKTIFKSIVKLLFGNQEEASATSRQVLSIMHRVLEILKAGFSSGKARSGGARTFRDSAEEAVGAGISIIQGYVKGVLANESTCQQRHLCRASAQASREARELGFMIASVGGYASSYLLDNQNSKAGNFKSLFEASTKGRTVKTIDECDNFFKCDENQL